MLNHRLTKAYTTAMIMNFQVSVLDRMLEAVVRCLNPEAARQLVALRADDAAQIRMDELAAKANQGTLTGDELLEYKDNVAAANVIAIMQAKARRIVTSVPHDV